MSVNQVVSVADMLLCTICQKTLDQPIQLSCSFLVCTGCLVQQLTASAQTFCPCCSPPHQLTPETIKPASQMIQRLLQDVLVKCMTCKRDVKTVDYDSHDCNSHDPKVLSTTLQHMLAEQSIVKVPTGGRVSTPTH